MASRNRESGFGRELTGWLALGLAIGGVASPARADDPKPCPMEAAPAYQDATPGGYAIDPISQTLTVNYSLSEPKRTNGRFSIRAERIKDEKLVVKFDPPDGYVLSDKLQIRIAVNYGANGMQIGLSPIDAEWNFKDSVFIVSQAELQELSNQLVPILNDNTPGFDSDTPVTVNGPATLTATPVLNIAGGSSKSVPVAGLLNVAFEQVVHPPSAAAATPPPPVPGQAAAPASQPAGETAPAQPTTPATTYQQQYKQVTEYLTQQVAVPITGSAQDQPQIEYRTQTVPVTRTVIESVPVTTTQTQDRSVAGPFPAAESAPAAMVPIAEPLPSRPATRDMSASWRRIPRSYLKGQATGR
ncbi:hypothetical protein [Paludisphaera mucosa]|uniref:Uncharacterized protein n=1 Tax=Paludisphaera mucosa TaxID=3030827 RepID=A0ABT6F4P4_9BACT|nr:hypothetical protein [Paludisphaera mucosa]MDG3002413.1 hypothetical protein [Paludisphaera mucosa]